MAAMKPALPPPSTITRFVICSYLEVPPCYKPGEGK